MFKKKPDSGKSRFSLAGLLFHPGVKIVGGVFSLLAAALFGGFQLSRRRKKKATRADARLASSHLLARLQEVRGQLADFSNWLKQQAPAQMDAKEIGHQYAGLKALYSEWTSHERMEEVLGTVQYDPKIGMNVSNGLHELRNLNILIEAILRDEELGKPEGEAKLAVVSSHLERAIESFSYTNKDLESVPESSITDIRKDTVE